MASSYTGLNYPLSPSAADFSDQKGSCPASPEARECGPRTQSCSLRLFLRFRCPVTIWGGILPLAWRQLQERATFLRMSRSQSARKMLRPRALEAGLTAATSAYQRQDVKTRSNRRGER